MRGEECDGDIWRRGGERRAGGLTSSGTNGRGKIDVLLPTVWLCLDCHLLTKAAAVHLLSSGAFWNQRCPSFWVKSPAGTPETICTAAGKEGMSLTTEN